MLLFTLPIAIVIGLLVSRYYHPETKTKKILASILIPLVTGVIIHLLVASCKNSGYGFAFDLGSTLAFVAIPEIALLVTLFITLKTLKTEKKETPTVEERNEDKTDAIGTEMQEPNEEPEKMESTKLAEEKAEEKPKRKDGMSKTIKILLVTFLFFVLLTVIGLLASFVYTRYIFPKQAKADDEALLETARNNPSKGYEIAQTMFERETNGHCSEYRGPITGWQGKCDFDHVNAGKDAAGIYCQYCIDSAKINYSNSADIAEEMLFNKKDGYCDDLYNKAGMEIIINGAV